jgi:polyisoprenoid-binding protein YceI
MDSMKKLIALLVVIAAAVVVYVYVAPQQPSPDAMVSPSVSPATSVAARQAALTSGEYVLDAASSSMSWEGKKPLIPGYTDKGTVALQSGSATVAGGAVTKGSVVVDFRTIKTLSTGKGSGESMMEAHIKSADFFDVEKYPTGEFVFESLTPTAEGAAYTVKGTLTIKGITKPVQFPATVSQDGNRLTMEATASLDRTLWDIRYGSGKFFENLGDKLIDDMFTVRFTAVGVQK